MMFFAEDVNDFIGPIFDAFESNVDSVGELSVGQLCIKERKISGCDVSVQFIVSGDLQGKCVVSVTSTAAIEIAEKVSAEPFDSFDSGAQDAVKDFFDSVFEKIQTKFSEREKQVEFSPPKLLYGRRVDLTTNSCSEPLTVPVHSALGEMELNLAFHN
jgi:CheY-specific phosphatase CheX